MVVIAYSYVIMKAILQIIAIYYHYFNVTSLVTPLPLGPISPDVVLGLFPYYVLLPNITITSCRLVLTSIHIFLSFSLFRCWGAGAYAGHHSSGPSLSLQHHRWYRWCSLCQCRLLVCMIPAIMILQVPLSPTGWLSSKNPSYAWVVWLWMRLIWAIKLWELTKPTWLWLGSVLSLGGDSES